MMGKFLDGAYVALRGKTTSISTTLAALLKVARQAKHQVARGGDACWEWSLLGLMCVVFVRGKRSASKETLHSARGGGDADDGRSGDWMDLGDALRQTSFPITTSC